MIKPMLAEEYTGNVNLPVYSQYKMAGCRCLVSKTKIEPRLGNSLSVLPGIADIQKYLPDDVTLDGELWLPCLTFEEILSRVKTNDGRKLEYHVFDIANTKTVFSSRMRKLRTVVKETEFIKIVNTQLVQTQTELDSLYKSYLKEGYEGLG